MTTLIASDKRDTYDCRVAFAAELTALAREDERIVAVCNDSVGSSNLGRSSGFPDRLINVGIAEQDMVGIGAGLANGGYIPFVSPPPRSSLAGMEQIKADVAYCGHHWSSAEEPGHGVRRARPDPPLDRGPRVDAAVRGRHRGPGRPEPRPRGRPWAAHPAPVFIRVGRLSVPASTPRATFRRSIG